MFLHDNPRPLPLCRLAFLLRPDIFIPEVIWISFDTYYHESEPSVPRPDSISTMEFHPSGLPELEKYINTGHDHINAAYVSVQEDRCWSGRSMSDGILICFRDQQVRSEGMACSINLCLWRMTTARRFNKDENRNSQMMRTIECVTLPRGPVVVAAQKGLNVGSGWRDVRAGDLTHVVNFFRGFNGDWDVYDPYSEVNLATFSDDTNEEDLPADDGENDLTGEASDKKEQNIIEEIQDSDFEEEAVALKEGSLALTRTESHGLDDKENKRSTGKGKERARDNVATGDDNDAMDLDDDAMNLDDDETVLEDRGTNDKPPGTTPITMEEALATLKALGGQQSPEKERALLGRVKGLHGRGLMVKHIRRRSKEEMWEVWP